MRLTTELYRTQDARWPKSGWHILAQFDTDSIVAYQAYKPAIGHFAAEQGHFGGDFSFDRMSWIKPNFAAIDGLRRRTRPIDSAPRRASRCRNRHTLVDHVRRVQSKPWTTSPRAGAPRCLWT